jgi:hypothetical protein
MNTTIVNATEYRDLPLAMLPESTTNPCTPVAIDQVLMFLWL